MRLIRMIVSGGGDDSFIQLLHKLEDSAGAGGSVRNVGGSVRNLLAESGVIFSLTCVHHISS